ncbi:MAG: polysaccharide biosynthesis C-terminal domain-containing protein, partial [Anaerolineales bacterium]|nr:polysaccharide biosynthesis C-terminal domain-containing protein [Anaerolineales bacterium]
QALGIAAFPTLAELAARSALREMRQIVVDSLRLVLFLGLPITVLFMLLRQPIITILFERGLFDADDTSLVAAALLFYALGLVALTALEVIARAFYSLNDTLTPVLAGGVQILLMAGLSLWLSRRLFPAVGGLALGYSLSNFVEVGLLLWLLRRRLGGINGRFLLHGLVRMGAASLAMGAGMWGMAQLWQTSSLWLQAISGTVVGTFFYLGASWLLRVEELTRFVGYGRRFLRRWI